LTVENTLVIYFSVILCLSVILSIRVSLSRQPLSLPVRTAPCASLEAELPAVRAAGFPRTEDYTSARYRDKSDTLSRTWPMYIELSVLRQFDSALLLAFDDLRIAGINRRRAGKIARAREYGRNLYILFCFVKLLFGTRKIIV